MNNAPKSIFIFKRAFIGLLFSCLVINVYVACSSRNMKKTITPEVMFDLNPATIIIYADIHYPGIPKPTQTPQDRYCASLPALRVWGDGYAFLDEHILNERTAVLSGQLDPPTIQALWGILVSEGFFRDWQEPGPANPSGTWLRIGAQLKNQPRTEYVSGNLGPSVYKRLKDAVKVKLKPAAEQNQVDARVDAILKENENCNKY